MTAANAAKAGYNQLILLSGAPEGIRTPDLCLRRAALYPAELRAHWSYAGLDSGSPPAQQRPRLPLATVAPIGWTDQRRSDAMAQLAEKREGKSVQIKDAAFHSVFRNFM